MKRKAYLILLLFTVIFLGYAPAIADGFSHRQEKLAYIMYYHEAGSHRLHYFPFDGTPPAYGRLEDETQASRHTPAHAERFQRTWMTASPSSPVNSTRMQGPSVIYSHDIAEREHSLRHPLRPR